MSNVKVRLNVKSGALKAGNEVTLPKPTADRLVKNGHATVVVEEPQDEKPKKG